MSGPSKPEDGRRLVPLVLDGLEVELSEMEYLALKPLLEANGIEVVLQGASQLPNLPYELLVPEDQLEQAVAIVAEARQAGPDAAEEGEAAGEGEAGPE